MPSWAAAQKKNSLSSALSDATERNFQALALGPIFAEPSSAGQAAAPAQGALSERSAPTEAVLTDAAAGDFEARERAPLLAEAEAAVFAEEAPTDQGAGAAGGARARHGHGRPERRPNERRGTFGRDASRARRGEAESEHLIEKLVHLNRVSKTVKGGKRFGFAALVVVGDGKGRAGFGHGKAREVPEAISKATAAAKKAMVRVPLKDGRTLHHDGRGHFGAGRVYVRSAPQGTGIIAGGPMRAVFESLGVADVVSKSVGTSNPYNMVRATFEALSAQQSPKSVAARRGKRILDIMNRSDRVEVEYVRYSQELAEQT